MALSYLLDAPFLKKLDLNNNKIDYLKIIVLNKEELPIQTIEGKVIDGSINIDGNSSIRRTCNITMVAENYNNDLTNIDNLLSINKKIKILKGIKNDIDPNYDDIIWFPQGIFVITQPNISHSVTSTTISLSCKDKMCLLNGECGGMLPASVTFHEYDQYKEDGSRESIKNLIYDIIQTAVHFYGGEALSKIFINDVPLEIKQSVRYVGNNSLYYSPNNDYYTTDPFIIKDKETLWQAFNFNEDVGYVYTDFIYPGELITNIGDNVCTVLDKIIDVLGNFEYFYDIDGNFVFQEIKNYLNTSYNPVIGYTKSEGGRHVVPAVLGNASVLNNINYKVDFNSFNKSAYIFDEKNGLISSYSNAPVFTNIKNDYHIWGKNNDGFGIHYHCAIKDKPKNWDTHKVVPLEDGRVRLARDNEIGYNYLANDWRAELYLRGLEKQKLGVRPDMYEQELLDLFDSIYLFWDDNYWTKGIKSNAIEYSECQEELEKTLANYAEKINTLPNISGGSKAEFYQYIGHFKADNINNPNRLNYFFDYLEPSSQLYDCSIDSINQRICTQQFDKVIKIYDDIFPDIIIFDADDTSDKKISHIERCEREGQKYSNVNSTIYSKLAIGTVGYSAQEKCRELLYQYTNYRETINIQSIPIYYLEPNTRISVYDFKSGINGDYIINSISLPLNGMGLMNITATKALDRL